MGGVHHLLRKLNGGSGTRARFAPVIAPHPVQGWFLVPAKPDSWRIAIGHCVIPTSESVSAIAPRASRILEDASQRRLIGQRSLVPGRHGAEA